MKKSFITRYGVNNNSYAGFVFAKDEKEALEILLTRRTKETIIGEGYDKIGLKRKSNASDAHILKNLPSIIHQYCWLSWIALKSEMISIDEVLGDEGVMHELIHLLDPDSEIQTKEDIRKVKKLLKKIEDLPLGIF